MTFMDWSTFITYLNELLGCVWIEFILLKLKTENWKHCSKIIFKCVNSAAGPIFNEKIDKKWNLWVHKQCTGPLIDRNVKKTRPNSTEQYSSFALVPWNTCRKEKKKSKTQKQNSDVGTKHTLSKDGWSICLKGLFNGFL